jgi:hypothetical protein
MPLSIIQNLNLKVMQKTLTNQNCTAVQREEQIESLIYALSDVAFSDMKQVSIKVSQAIGCFIKQHPETADDMLDILIDVNLMCLAISGSSSFILREFERNEMEVEL